MIPFKIGEGQKEEGKSISACLWPSEATAMSFAHSKEAGERAVESYSMHSCASGFCPALFFFMKTIHVVASGYSSLISIAV